MNDTNIQNYSEEYFSAPHIMNLLIIWQAGDALVLMSCVCRYLFSNVWTVHKDEAGQRFHNEFLAPNERKDLEMETEFPI